MGGCGIPLNSARTFQTERGGEPRVQQKEKKACENRHPSVERELVHATEGLTTGVVAESAADSVSVSVEATYPAHPLTLTVAIEANDPAHAHALAVSVKATDPTHALCVSGKASSPAHALAAAGHVGHVRLEHIRAPREVSLRAGLKGCHALGRELTASVGKDGHTASALTPAREGNNNNNNTAAARVQLEGAYTSCVLS